MTSANDIYAVALDLYLSETQSPAKLRSSISRFYYAAFHRASEMLRSIGITLPKGPECHAKLQFLLSQSGDTDLVSAGTKLGELRTARNEADYDLANMKAESPRHAEFCFHVAARIISCIDLCFSGGPKANVHAAIRKYAKDVLKLQVK